MSTLTEIKTAIAELAPRDRALLAAEFIALQPEPAADDPQLQAALARGLEDVKAGRVRPAEEVRGLISSWATKL